jgi:hypothetical protein
VSRLGHLLLWGRETRKTEGGSSEG